MIYDASTPALPREGSSVQHASFTDERAARDSVIFVPHITPGSYCMVFFVRGLRHHLDEAPDGRGVRSTVGSIEADRFECVAREQLAKDPGERARACEHLEQHERSPMATTTPLVLSGRSRASFSKASSLSDRQDRESCSAWVSEAAAWRRALRCTSLHTAPW